MEGIVQLRGVSKSYGALEVLHSINLAIASSTVTTILGTSGAGKTTLLQIIGTIMRPDHGSLLIDGQDVSQLKDRALSQFRNQQIGFVFQFHHLLPEFTALENVCIPAMIGRQRLSQAKRRASELLDYLGLSDRLSHKPSALSGGEQQRVAVARALMNEPKIVLADEPSGNLDMENKEELHRLFFRLRDEFGQTFIIVTHDMALSKEADRIITLRDGSVLDSHAETGPDDRIVQ